MSDVQVVAAVLLVLSLAWLWIAAYTDPRNRAIRKARRQAVNDRCARIDAEIDAAMRRHPSGRRPR